MNAINWLIDDNLELLGITSNSSPCSLTYAAHSPTLSHFIVQRQNFSSLNIHSFLLPFLFLYFSTCLSFQPCPLVFLSCYRGCCFQDLRFSYLASYILFQSIPQHSFVCISISHFLSTSSVHRSIPTFPLSAHSYIRHSQLAQALLYCFNIITTLEPIIISNPFNIQVHFK